jgi:tRNA nucleotidyltransferase/poly(A) polymerase
MQLFVVGGAVRDHLLGIVPKDFDLATNATPDEVIAIAQRGNLKIVEVGKAFGVVIVNGHEIATFREDVGKGRRPDSVKFTTIEGDVKRRDLTINALFFNIDTNEIIDLVGGIDDLKQSIIRTVGSAKERFEEDALRKLRTIRFAGRLDGKLDQEIIDCLTVDPSLDGVSPERIRDEFLKGIVSAKSPKRFLNTAKDLNLLPLMLPGLDINTTFTDFNDPIIQLAFMLKRNEVTVVHRTLNILKFSTKEVNNITHLMSLISFVSDDVLQAKKRQKKTTLTREQFKIFGKLINKEHVVDKLFTFELSVGGKDVPKELKGKAIGDFIEQEEVKNFKKVS